MLLSAVVLLAGFLVLTAMVARVTLLPLQTQTERADGFDSEMKSMHAGVEYVVGRLDNVTRLGGEVYETKLAAILDAMSYAQAGRGYGVRYTVTCPAGDHVQVFAQIQTATTYAEFTVERSPMEVPCQ